MADSGLAIAGRFESAIAGRQEPAIVGRFEPATAVAVIPPELATEAVGVEQLAIEVAEVVLPAIAAAEALHYSAI